MGKNIQVIDEHHEEYAEFTKELNEELGGNLKLPQMLHMAVTFYKQRRKAGQVPPTETPPLRSRGLR